MLEWECYLENYISRLSFLRTENIHYIKLKKQSVRNHLFWHLKNLLPRIIHKSQHSKKFVALTMTNDFIDIKVIGHGRGKQPKRRDTKKGWVQIHGLDICIPHTYCSKIRKKKSISQYYLHFLIFTSECSRLCVCPTLTIGLVQKAPLGFQK